jgi:hypothetical protein
MRHEFVPDKIPARYLGTVVDVLQKFAEYEQVKLPEDAALYIAQTFQFNAGSLKGALRRVIAYSSLTGTAITLATTQKALQDNIDEKDRAVALDSLPEVASPPFGKQKSKVKFRAAMAAEGDFVLCLLEGKKIRRVRNQLEVNMRDKERHRLAKRDAYERELERRAKTRH